MENTLQVFTGVAPSKTSIQEQCKAIINEITEGGNVNPLRVATTMKAMETAMKAIKSGIEELILEEAEKHGKSFDFDGHSISVRESGARYDYSNCNDPVLNDAISSMEALKETIKERENLAEGSPEKPYVVRSRPVRTPNLRSLSRNKSSVCLYLSTWRFRSTSSSVASASPGAVSSLRHWIVATGNPLGSLVRGEFTSFVISPAFLAGMISDSTLSPTIMQKNGCTWSF